MCPAVEDPGRTGRCQGSFHSAQVFRQGEAFQFDWSTEYTFIGGIRRRVELAHTKLCTSRAFWLVVYPGQGHETLFDAHARAFEAFGGVPQRGIYDLHVDGG